MSPFGAEPSWKMMLSQQVQVLVSRLPWYCCNFSIRFRAFSLSSEIEPLIVNLSRHSKALWPNSANISFLPTGSLANLKLSNESGDFVARPCAEDLFVFCGVVMVLSAQALQLLSLLLLVFCSLFFRVLSHLVTITIHCHYHRVKGTFETKL